METKKSMLAIAVAMGLGLSGMAWADQGGDGSPNTNADDGGLAANVTDNLNNNSDNSTHVDVADSGNDNSTDNSNRSTNLDIADSGNNSSDNSDSSAKDSYNADNSTATLNLTVETFLNDADLSGTVSDVNVTYGSAEKGGEAMASSSNKIDGGSANFTGVGAFAQNAGVGSVTQANVNVMSNLSTGGN
ncbi:hypothetical protein [Marinobacter sp.]|uniref:hypothetical protein n=1 Tax=Marinobacter sp. TaxID=50741 RepID=UPI0034A32B81